MSCLFLVNMEEVVCQGKNLDNELGKHLRQLEKRHVPIYGKLVLALVQVNTTFLRIIICL